MSAIKLCKECGVPLMVSKGHTWHDNGVITQTRDPDHRMVFYESDNLDALFAGIEEILGLSIEKIIVESKRREVKEYVEKMLPAVARRVARLVGIGAVINNLSKNGRAFGYGDISLVERRRRGDDDDFITMSVRNPHSLLFFSGEVLGAWEAIDGREHFVEHEQVGGEAFNITCRAGPHPIELQERLKFKSYSYKPSDFVFRRCSSCGVPLDVAEYEWNLEEGTIKHPQTGRRVAVFGPRGVEAILDDLEAELGSAIPEVVIEAQRRFVREAMRDINWLGDAEAYRATMAYRGLGNLTSYEATERQLRITVENRCMSLLIVGMVQALFELASGLEKSKYEYERFPDGGLAITVSRTD